MNVYSISLKGLRPQNEDNHEIILNMDGKDPNIKNINLFAIFDGHGGKQVSNYLKENLPKFFVDTRITYPISKKYVMSVYDYLQKCIAKHAFAKKMGSTCLVVCHFKNNNEEYLNIMNTGDSRCILCRDNFAIALSKDQKPHWPQEFYRITALGGEVKFDGMDWRVKDLSVSRAFGDLDATPFVTHVPELFRYKLDKTDKFIIIACDGLFEKLENQTVVNFVLLNCYDSTLNNRINKHKNIAKMLGEYAIKSGSCDNISIIIVFFDHNTISFQTNMAP